MLEYKELLRWLDIQEEKSHAQAAEPKGDDSWDVGHWKAFDQVLMKVAKEINWR